MLTNFWRVSLGTLFCNRLPRTNSRKRTSQKLLNATETLEQRTLLSTFYVSLSGDDATGTGTVGAPYRSIQKALNAADADSTSLPHTINVASGTYSQSGVDKGFGIGSSSGANPNLHGLTLDGGWDATFTTQTFGSTTYIPQTNVNNGNPGPTSVASDALTPDITVYTPGTTVRGFTFVFDGQAGDGGLRITGGLQTEAQSVIITQNTIEVGYSSGNPRSAGIVVHSSPGGSEAGVQVTNNTIQANAGTTFGFSNGSTGIFINPDTVGRVTPIIVSGNTISGSNLGVGIAIDRLSYVNVDGNSISRTGSTPGSFPLIDLRQATAGTGPYGSSQTGINITNNDLNGLSPSGNTGIELSARGSATQQVTGVNITNNFIRNVQLGVNTIQATVIGTGVTVSDNSFSNVASRTINFGGTGTMNASGNWFGSNVLSTISGLISGAVDYSPFLDVSTDTAPGTIGFQGSFNVLHATAAGLQTGSSGRIQEALDSTTGANPVVIIEAGTYNETVSLTGTSTLKLAGTAAIDSLDSSIGTTIDLQSNGLTVGNNSGNNTIAGVIQGAGGNLIKQGSDTLTLTNSNTYTGTTTINGGILELSATGSLFISSAVSVNNFGTLAGVGTVAGTVSVASGGTVAPGLVGAIGKLNSGSITLASGASFSAVVNGNSTPGTDFDQLDVTGTVNVTGATLSVSGTIVSSIPQSIVLIKNDGTDAVTGTFNGLPEGATVTVNGVSFGITYFGGDGNDVVLVEADANIGLDAAGNLVFSDITSATNDNISVTSDGTNLIISEPGSILFSSIAGASGSGTGTLTIPIVSVTGTQVIFNTGSGDDTLTVDFSSGSFTKTIVFHGGSQVTTDTLVITGGSTTTVTHSFVNDNDGSVTLSGPLSGTIIYTGLEPITDNIDAANRIFQFTGAAENITVTDQIAGDGMLRIDSTLGEFVDFPNPTVTLTIDVVTGAAVGSDSITFSSIDSGYRASTSITAGNDDTVNLNVALNLGSATSSGDFSVSNAATVNLNAGISTDAGTNAGSIAITGPVMIGANITLDTNGTGTDGNITFNSPINDSVANSHTVSLDAGIADIQLGSVGSTTRLGGITITSAHDVTGTTVLASAAGVNQISGTGTSTFTGLLEATGGGSISLSGTNFSLSGGLRTTSGAGGISVSHTGANSLSVSSGNVSLATGGTLVITGNTGATTGNVSSTITGTNANLTKQGSGTLTLSGASANTFSGLTTVAEGTLILNKSSGVAVAGNITVGNGAGTDTLQLGSANQISDSSDVTVNASGGTFDLNGFSETFDGLNGGGSVTNGAGGAATLTVGGNGEIAANFSGVIQLGTGTISLVKTGSGTQTLSGANLYSGTTTINGGKLSVTGSTSGSTVAVNNTGILAGTGSVGGTVTVSTGGTITGGDVGTVGTLTVGSLAFNGGTYAADLIGNSGDQILTSGTVNLQNPGQGIFTLNSSGTPTDGTNYTLINKTSAGALSNPPFSGITEGLSTVIGGKSAYYSYVGGAGGNDFTLSVAGPVAYTSDGLGAGALELRFDGTNVQFLDDGTIVDSRPLASVSNQLITVNGTAGQNETLFVNYGGAGGFFDADVLFHGGASGADNDALRVTGGTFTTVSHTFTTAGPEHSGNIVYNTALAQQATISYDGLEPIDMSGSTIANLVFNLPGAGDQAILEDGTGGNVSQIRSQAGVPTFETTLFTTPTGSLTVNMGGDSGSLTVDSLDAAFNSTLNINGQAGTDSVNFQGANASFATLNVAVVGNITDSSGATLGVTGLAVFDSGSGTITLGDNAGDTTNFGSLTVVSTAAVSIREDSSTILAGINSANSLSLTSETGSISDNNGTSLTVTNNATLATTGAGQSITLGDNGADTTNFGSLTMISSGAVSISENSAMVLTGTNSANSLSLTSETGTITDNVGTSLSVVTNATLVTSAANQAITLGDTVGDTTNFGSLTFTSTGAVSISEDSSLALSGTSSAASLVLTSETGSITDNSGTTLTVTGNATLATSGAAQSITLGDNGGDTTNFGTLTFTSTGSVSISENSALVLSGSSTADSLLLTSETGSITDNTGTSLVVTNNATLVTLAVSQAITLGDTGGDTTNFGSLTFTSTGAVAISENSGTVLTGTSTANSLTLTSETGSMSDTTGTSLTVTNNANFVTSGASQSIALGDQVTDTTDFGSLTFSSTGSVSISENSSTLITGTNSADSLLLTSEAGSITDNTGTTLSVTNNATLITSAVGQTITLGDNVGDTTNFGTLTVTSTGAVSISENSGTVLSGVNTAASLNLTSETGSITDAAATSLTVTGTAVLVTAGAGQALTLGDNATDTTNFGSLQVTSTGPVTLTEDSNTDFVNASTAASLTINTTGNIADGATGDLTISGLATFNATGNVTLGDSAANDTNFGSLTFSGSNIDIAEDSNMILAGSSSGTLVGLLSTGSITDGSAASIIVTATSLSLNGATGVGNADPLEISVTNFAAAGGTGGVLISNTGDLTITTVTPAVLAAVTGVTGSADSFLQGSGAITINSAITIGGSADLTLDSGNSVTQTAALTATGLQLLSNGTGGAFTLTNTGNNVATLAANTTNTIYYVDSNSLTIGSVAGALSTTNGIATTNSDVSLKTQSGNITISNAINLGTPATGGDLELILNDATSGTVTQGGSGDILAHGLSLLSTGTGTYQFTLDNSTNNVANLASDFRTGLATFALRYQDADDLHVTSVAGLTSTTTGISSGNPANGGGVRLRAGTTNANGQLFVDSDINTSSGSGGNLLIGGGVVTTANFILGTGSIDLAGGANFPDIIVSTDTSITLSSGTATLQPNRDIIVRALLQSINGGLTLNADFDNNGVGGVWVDESTAADAQINAAGNLLIQGSDVFATGASVDSVRVDDDTTPTTDQIVASGTLTLQSKLGTAPAAADVFLDGIVRTSGAGTVTVVAQDSVFLTSQVTSSTGSLILTATTGSVIATDSGLASPEILANASATITINANDTTNLGSDVTVQSAGGAIEFNTNDIVIDTTSASVTNSVSGTVTIRNFSAGRLIDLGTNTAGALGITDAELDRVIQASVIRIGRRADGQDSGNINVTSGPIDAANVATLHLISGDSILETASGFITETNLAAEASNSIRLNTATDTPGTPNQNDNDVDTLALRTFNAGSDATFWDADGFVIAAIDGVSGINVVDIVQLSSGVESTLVGSDVTQTSAVLANGLQLLGQGNFTLDLSSNDVATLASSVLNSVTYTDANTVIVGTLSLNAITTVGTSSSSIIITAPTIVVNNAITTTSELGFVILDVTTLLDINGTIGGGAAIDPIINSKGFVQQAGTGAVQLQGQIVTTEDNVAFNGPVTIGTTAGSSAIINTGSAAGGNITFNSTVQGTTGSATPTFENLTLNAGTGDILFNSQVGGGGQRLGILTIQTARHVTTNVGVTAREIKQNAGTGETRFNGFVQTNQAAGIDLTGNYITFNGSIQTTNGGTVKINNASDFQLVAGAGAINSDGAFNQSGVGLSLIGGDIVTTDDAISFAADTYISNSPVQLNAGLGNVSFAKLLQVNNKTLTIRDGNTVDLGTRTTIANGTLNAFVGNSATVNSLTLASGSLFTGAGTVNAILNVGTGATLAPASATTLLGTGVLTVNGNVNLASSSVLAVDLNSATVGTGYDQLAIAGAGNTLNITSGAVLQATRSGSFSPSIGTSLKILDGVNSVSGTFVGASGGTTLFLNGAYFTIDYNSPTGDITLTSAAAPGGAAKIIDNDETSGSQYAAATNNGTLTFSPAASWTMNTVAGRGFTNDLRFAAGASSATATATYTFGGLTPGAIYRVSTTWFEQSNRATNAKFTVSTGSGGSANALATLNQRNAPNSFTANGAKWQDLSTAFTVGSNGTITITLTNLADGYVIADAIRIEAQTSAGPEVQVINATDGNVDLANNAGTVNFGTTLQGGTGVTKVINIQNVGSTPLVLGSATLVAPAGFQIVSGYSPTSLAPGAVMPVTIKLLATTAGNYSGSISFQTNDTDENPFTFNVSGSVVSDKVWIVDNSPNSGSDLVVGPAPTTGAYSETGSWTNNTDPNVGYLQDLRFANAGAASTATWNFGGLVAGTYRVSVTYRAESNRASNASFTVTGGTSTPVSINERNSPDDFLSSGVYWEDLVSSYTISGSTLTVTLNAAGTNGYVIADAVRIERLSPLEAAGGVATTPTSQVLSDADLQQTAAAAIARWQSQGLTEIQQAALNSMVFVIQDLPDASLGSQTEATIFIDPNAAGYGWFVDFSPSDDLEFVPRDGLTDLDMADPNYAGQMDLLTVLMHELGHRLGLEDDTASSSDSHLMTESIAPGIRRLPNSVSSLLQEDEGDPSELLAECHTTDAVFYTFGEHAPRIDGGVTSDATKRGRRGKHSDHEVQQQGKVDDQSTQRPSREHHKRRDGADKGKIGRFLGRLFGRGK